MFNHQYDDDGHHRITVDGLTPSPISGPWASYSAPAIMNTGPIAYIAFTTYNYPARSPEHNALQYPGPYADIVYQLKEIDNREH